MVCVLTFTLPTFTQDTQQLCLHLHLRLAAPSSSPLEPNTVHSHHHIAPCLHWFFCASLTLPFVPGTASMTQRTIILVLVRNLVLKCFPESGPQNGTGEEIQN